MSWKLLRGGDPSEVGCGGAVGRQRADVGMTLALRPQRARPGTPARGASARVACWPLLRRGARVPVRRARRSRIGFSSFVYLPPRTSSGEASKSREPGPDPPAGRACGRPSQVWRSRSGRGCRSRPGSLSDACGRLQPAPRGGRPAHPAAPSPRHEAGPHASPRARHGYGLDGDSVSVACRNGPRRCETRYLKVGRYSPQRGPTEVDA